MWRSPSRLTLGCQGQFELHLQWCHITNPPACEGVLAGLRGLITDGLLEEFYFLKEIIDKYICF